MRIALLIMLLVPTIVWNQSSFPDEWLGKYHGDMILSFADMSNDTIPVDFELIELISDSTWSYKMIYHSEKYGEITKDYRILAKKKGDSTNFLLDELNGIVMEQTLMNDCLYGIYEVQGNLFTLTIRKIMNTLFFELYSASTKSPRVSKTNSEEGEEVIEASSYKPTLVQSVLLEKE